MNSIENKKKLLDASIKGQWCELSKTIPDITASEYCIKADYIRSLLLGITPPLPGKPNNKRVQAVKLRGAIIDGFLDLEDCSGPDGTPLPPLLLENCILTGGGYNKNKEGMDKANISIDASHACLSRLSLQNCQVGIIYLNDAKIHGNLEMHGIKRIIKNKSNKDNNDKPKKNIPCQIIAQGCYVDGSIIIQKTTLVYSENQLSKRNKPDFALNIRGAEVTGSCIFQPNFIAVGGVNIADAHVKGEIWAEGAKFIASDETAFFAQALKCDGVVAIRTLFKDNNIKTSICKVFGEINFFAASIGFLDLDGIKLLKATNNNPLFLLNIVLAKITNRILLTNQPVIKGEIDASGLKVGGDMFMQLFDSPIDLEGAHIGGKLDVYLQGNAILKARDLEVHGSVSISGKINQQKDKTTLCFDGGKFHSEFKIDDLTFVQIEGIVNGTDKFIQEEIPIITINDAHIDHDFLVNQLKAKFKIQKWARIIPKRVFVTQLGFYPAWQLVELLIKIDDKTNAIIGYLKKNDNEILLTGKSIPIHEMNERGNLELTSENVLDYLRFFCSYVWGDEGAFTIVESKDKFALSKLPKEIDLKEALIKEHKTENDKEHWICSASVLYGIGLFQATFKVFKDGQIEMIDDKPLAEIHKTQKISYKSPLQSFPENLKLQNQSFFWRPTFSERVDEKIPNENILNFLKKCIKNRYPICISLIGLKTDVFRHNSKNSWGEGIVLNIDGFEYNRVELMEQNGIENKNRESDKPSDHGSASNFISNFLEKSRIIKGETSTKSVAIEAINYKKWLLIQFPDKKPNEKDFKSFPYEHLAFVLRKQGQYDVAKHIMLEKLSLERQFIHDGFVRPIFWLFEKLFDYGLFSYKSVLLFFFLWFSGWNIFQYTNYKHHSPPLMVVSSTPVSPAILRDYGKVYDAVEPVMLYLPNQTEVNNEIPCGDQIDSFWYALDVMVPLLDLKQESKCEISTRDEFGPWALRLFKNAFAVVGTIITSIMILSVSGVLKRRIEQ